MKSFRCTFGPLHDTDFVWPPPSADVKARGVLLSSDEVPPADAVASAPADAVASAPPPVMEAQSSSEDQAAELVWPPPADDLEACTVVELSETDEPVERPPRVTIEDFRLHSSHMDSLEVEEDTPTAELELPPSVLARLRTGMPSADASPYPDAEASDVEPPPVIASDPAAAVEPPPSIPPAPSPIPPAHAPSPFFTDAPEYAEEPEYDEDVDEEPAPAYPFALPVADRVVEPPPPRGNGLMWAAVLVALSGLAIGYSEFRAGRREAMQVVRQPGAPPAAARPAAPPDPVVTFERAPERSAPEPVASPEPVPEPPARSRTAEPPRRPEPEPEPEPEPQPRPAPRVVLRSASAAPARPAAPEPTPVPASSPVTAPEPAPTPTPAVAMVTPRTPIAEPVVHTAALESAADAAAMAADEQHIESTLTRFRTAYSKLDARAAREVWPSVDVEALDRAFRGLKSQDLRFDRCDLTVDGTRARAACRGSAVYVPRVGNQSPKATAREWTFELKKSDQRWTIASARSS